MTDVAKQEEFAPCWREHNSVHTAESDSSEGKYPLLPLGHLCTSFAAWDVS